MSGKVPSHDNKTLPGRRMALITKDEYERMVRIMGLGELFILAVGLSMDAFAVSICKGLCLKRIRFRDALTAGIWFGVFQAGMPLIGYFLGAQFREQIQAIDHWVAFVLLGVIGINMIRESRSKKEEEVSCDVDLAENGLDMKSMFLMAVATSIDALAVGITFAFLNVSIVPAVSFIGIVTLVCSTAGMYIGHSFGSKLKSKAELGGGIILILIGLKILLEHLEILVF